MDKRNRRNRNKLKIHQGDVWGHMYSWRNKISLRKHKKVLLLAMIAGSLIFTDGLYTTYVYADGGQQIHGISVNVDPGGEPGNNYNNDGAGYLGVAIGNRASSQAGYGTAVGPFAKADALYSNATGFYAQALGQYSAAYGAGAKAINGLGVAFGQGAVVSLGKPLKEEEYNGLPEPYKKLFTAVRTEEAKTVYYQTKILLKDGSTQDQSICSVAIGASAAARDNNAVAIGYRSSADEMGAVGIGAFTEAKGKQGLALGYVAKAIGDFSTAVGQWSQANGDHAVAIGYGAITEKNQAGVAIGYESHSMRIGGKGWNPVTDQVWDDSEAQIESLGLKEKVKALDEEIAKKQALEQQAKEALAKFPNDPDLIEKARVAHNEKAEADEKKNKLFATWKTPTGDVAVGNSDTGMTRQITGVAAGSEDTDAVNVAQLKALNRKNVTQLNALNSKVDTFDTKIETVKKIAEGNKIHYFSVGPDNEKGYPVGENYNNDGVEQHGGIAIGFDASSKDGDGIAIGKSAQARGWQSIGIGEITYSIGDFSTSIGTRAQAFGERASAYGSLARAYGANGVAIGTGTLVASKKAITKAEFDLLSKEQKAWYNTDKVNQQEFYQYRGINKDGEVKDIETNGTAVGNGAKSIGSGGTAVGHGASSIGTSGVAVGDHAKASDIDNVNGSDFGVAIGAYSQNKVAQGVALGASSVSDRAENILGYLPNKNGIIEYFEDAMEAVGKGKEFTDLKNEYTQVQAQMNAAKVASDGNPGNPELKTKYEQAKQKFDALTTKYAIMTAPWTSRKGAVSIGNDKKGQTRQLIGVAAGSEDTDAVNVAQLKALNDKVDKGSIHYFSVNSSKPAKLDGTNWSNDGATGEDAVAIGSKTKAQGKSSTALGTGAKAQGKSSTALGNAAKAEKESSTALGYRAIAKGVSSMALGHGAIAEKDYSTALGREAQALVDGSVALGEGTVAGRAAGKVGYVASAGDTTFDAVLTALGKKTDYDNWTATINPLKETYDNLTKAYFGAQSFREGVAAKDALDKWKGEHKEFLDALEEKSKLEATWRATKAAVSVGVDGVNKAGNRIIESRQITHVAAGSEDTDAVNVAQLKALNDKVDKGSIHYFSVNSTDQGVGSNWDNDGATGKDAVAIGNGAIAKALDSTALGTGAQAEGLYSTALGYLSEAKGYSSAALGQFSEAQGQYSMALGYGAEAQGDSSMALGQGAQAPVDGSVALGEGTVTGRKAGTVGYLASAGGTTFDAVLTALGKKTDYDNWTTTINPLKEEYDKLTQAYFDAGHSNNDAEKAELEAWKGQHANFIEALTAKEKLEATWKATKAAVSVGADGVNEAGNRIIESRQITNVAAGTQDTDAVNVAQLKALENKVDKGSIHYFSVKSGESVNSDGTNWNNDGATGEDSVAIGSKTKAQGDYSTALGNGAQAQGHFSTALGRGAQAQSWFSTALGYGAQAQGKSSTALGQGAQALVEGSVALGEGTVAGRAAGTVGYLALGGSATFEDALKILNKTKDYDKWTAIINDKKADYDNLTKAFEDARTENDKTEAKTNLDKWKGEHQDFVDALKEKSKLEATWRATKAAVSVGVDGVDEAGNRIIESRQITNVAAGTQDTDAVNVAQLKALANAPMNFYFGGTKDKTTNVYTPGTTNWSMPLNEFRMDFGDGLKAEQVTDKDGNKYTRVTLDKESLKGDPAFKGEKGADGTNGKSAYDIWLDKQTDKTKKEQDFLNSLKGKDGQAGATGKSAYQVWKELQNPDGSKPNENKTKEEFIASLKGEKGENGKDGVVADVTVKASEKGEGINEAKFVITTKKPEMTFVGDRNIKTLIEKDNTVKIGLKDTITAETINVGKKVKINDDGAIFGDVKINEEKGKGTITGLSNTTWDVNKIVSGRAATEDQLNQATQNMQNHIYEIGKHMNGIAASNAALAGLHPLEYDEDDKWNLSAAIGNYKGANAFALGAFYRPNERTLLSVGGTLAGEEHLLNVGLSLKTGPGTAGKVYVSRAAMAREIQALKLQNKQREAESQKLLQDNRAIREENKEMKKELEWLKAQVAQLMAK